VSETKGMTLERAIEILELDKDCGFEGDVLELIQAHDLGIEAMRRLREYREDPEFCHWVTPLPGETEES